MVTPLTWPAKNKNSQPGKQALVEKQRPSVLSACDLLICSTNE